MSTETTLSLTKGEKVPLTKDNPGLKNIQIGLGWDVNSTESAPFDLDAFLLALKGGKLPSNDNVVYFKNKKPAGLGVEHMGDNLTGVGEGDDEIIKVDLSAVPADIDELVVCVNIFDAVNRGNQNFGQVKNSFIRVVNGDNQTELKRFDLNEDYSANNAMIMGKIYRHEGEWKFQAIGEGKNGDINDVSAQYR